MSDSFDFGIYFPFSSNVLLFFLVMMSRVNNQNEWNCLYFVCAMLGSCFVVGVAADVDVIIFVPPLPFMCDSCN